MLLSDYIVRRRFTSILTLVILYFVVDESKDNGDEDLSSNILFIGIEPL